MSAAKTPTVAIIGCGNMGSALAQRLTEKYTVFLYDHSLEKAKNLAKKTGSTPITSLKESLPKVQLIILAMKPKDLEKAVKELKPHLSPATAIGSILSGINLAILNKHFGKRPIVRLMPNIAAAYGKSMTALCADESLKEKERGIFSTLAAQLGETCWISEEMMPGFMALAGSGPAFLFVMIESIVDAAIAMGFSSTTALPLVLQSVESAVEIIKQSKEHPGALKWKVCSPAGTTIAGIQALEKHQLRHAIIQTYLDCFQKSH